MTEQTTIEDAGAAEGFSAEVAEYTETAAALARLEFRMKNVVHDVATTKGMDAAKKDRAELRTLRTTLDKKRLQLNADDQARIKTRNDEAKRITSRIEELEDPIDQQIKIEEKRKEDEKIARAQREQERLLALRTRIETMAGLALRSVGKPSAYIAEKITLLEGMSTDDFEEMTPVAVNTKTETLGKLCELLLVATHHERAVAELESSRQREEAQRAENERLHREAQERIDRQAREDRERREAEEAAERDRQLKARQEEDARRAVEEKDRERTAYINELVLDSVGADADAIENHLVLLRKIPNALGAEVDTDLVNAERRLSALLVERKKADQVAAEANQREAERLAEEHRQRDALAAEQRAQAERDAHARAAKELAERQEREAEQQRRERIRLDAEASRSALEKAAPKMQQLLAQTAVFLRTIANGPHAEEAKRLHGEIMAAVGDLRPVLDDEPA